MPSVISNSDIRMVDQVGHREGDLPPSRASRQERSLVYNRPGFVLNKCQSFRAERHV